MRPLWTARHLDAHLQGHAEVCQPLGDVCGHVRAEALLLGGGFLADEGHVGAAQRERCGELAADEPGPEHDRAGAWLGLRGDAFAVGALAHRLHPRVVEAGEIGACGLGAGGEHDRVAAKRGAVDVDGPGARVDRGGFTAEAQLYVVLVKPVLGLDRQLAGVELAAQELLGQRRPAVWDEGLLAEQRHLSCAAVLAVGAGGRQAGWAGADDHDPPGAHRPSKRSSLYPSRRASSACQPASCAASRSCTSSPSSGSSRPTPRQLTASTLAP